ncbi:uncharacterized protein YcgL-like [Bactrocera neohumeralis]|uniref:uncharacterized protein YcgL-like n=1 Tax=Bactrocera neohumeralis TaxID=98809 RepID=UPI0021660E31|nr:uncharacterized protein YcgL-like [Bactrocera neohumeralis]
MVERIRSKIVEIERKKNIRVINSCVSGSRSFNLHNENSDIDLRLIYVDHPDWYFKLNKDNDCFEERDGDLDIVGFNMHKSIKSIIDSNAAFHEWVKSPLVIERSITPMAGIEHFCKKFYNPLRVYHYYDKVGKTTIRELQGERAKYGEDSLTPEMIKLITLYVRCTLSKTLCNSFSSIPLNFSALVHDAKVPVSLKGLICGYMDFIDTYNGTGSIEDVNVMLGSLMMFNTGIDERNIQASEFVDPSEIFKFHRDLVIRRCGV